MSLEKNAYLNTSWTIINGCARTFLKVHFKSFVRSLNERPSPSFSNMPVPKDSFALTDSMAGILRL